jgi:undecaprenyl-phosphate 4-deoxy-4-formamido-L-arabinose transferase
MMGVAITAKKSVRRSQEKGKVKVHFPKKDFGEHNAVMCALNYADGDFIAIIDDDFQNPPEEIVKLMDEALKGYDVVYSKYEIKKHHWFRNFGSRFNDIVATWLLSKPRNLYLSSFKVINKATRNEIIKYTGPFPYIDGLILRVTNSISAVYVQHDARKVGRSNYTLAKLVSLWLNMFINFSIKPLRVFTLFGIIISLVSFVLALYFIIDKILYPQTQSGWTSLAVAILFFSGMQIVFMGLLGEYIGKQYLDSNKTPQWTIKKEIL